MLLQKMGGWRPNFKEALLAQFDVVLPDFK
jgi:hypothetical protein